MITKKLLIFVIILAIQGCDLFQQEEKEKFIKLVPDHTPFIVSTLEATVDTVHHYPEVFVGYLSDFQKGEDGYLPYPIPGIWWPILNAQVYHIASDMRLSLGIEKEAKVVVTGPLNHPKEKGVVFKYEDFGVYGDQNYLLPLIAKESYKLSVTLPDGRSYTAVTRIPALPQWQVADTVKTPLKLTTFYTGDYVEESKEVIPFSYTPSPKAVYTIGQFNHQYDYEALGVTTNDELLYGDRGPYWRQGLVYTIRTNDFIKINWLGLIWTNSPDYPLRYSERSWGRLSQINKDLGPFYQNVFNWIGMASGDPWSLKETKQVQARLRRDTTYLFGISNILKVGENGKALPKSETDAIGVFGGFSTAYRSTVMIPIRSWDPDTLNWGN
ncbi:MAG TPA: hypothetical protein VF181_01760 [Balneolaceae bacterium]